MKPVALTIAGSDPSGGAGLQADLKTFQRHGVYGTSVVTLLTVQNTQGVEDVRVLDSEFVLAQLEAVLGDVPPAAAKTGALGGRELIQSVAKRAAEFEFPLVVDPVMISKHGHRLIDQDAEAALREELLPQAHLVTPNLHEASVLAGMEVGDGSSVEKAAERIGRWGCRNVLIKAGHLKPQGLDLLWMDGIAIRLVNEPIECRHTHGSGCAFSAAVTANLALGCDLVEAVRSAKKFIAEAIRTAGGIGSGVGPINLLPERR